MKQHKKTAKAESGGRMPENFLSNSIKTTVEIGRRMPKRPFKQHKNYGRIWRKDAGKLPFKQH